jgi:hypothetical protein
MKNMYKIVVWDHMTHSWNWFKFVPCRIQRGLISDSIVKLRMLFHSIKHLILQQDIWLCNSTASASVERASLRFVFSPSELKWAGMLAGHHDSCCCFVDFPMCCFFHLDVPTANHDPETSVVNECSEMNGLLHPSKICHLFVAPLIKQKGTYKVWGLVEILTAETQKPAASVLSCMKHCTQWDLQLLHSPAHQVKGLPARSVVHKQENAHAEALQIGTLTVD